MMIHWAIRRFMKVTDNWKEAAKKWDRDGSVWSASLGGIGPGYEQAIQILLWEILLRWDETRNPMEKKRNEYTDEYNKHVDTIVHELNDSVLGFSGAQVSAAKGTAFQFIKFGYQHMMAKLPCEREILVSKDFPKLS